MTDETPLFCARCAVELRPGRGDFYRVTIEAVADPAAPEIDEDVSAEELRRRIEELLSQLEGVSSQEAMDQVYRRRTLSLCGPCYRRWIEDPVGGMGGGP
jgi:hypothetical protein